MLRMTCCNDGLMDDHLAISRGDFTAPLNPLKTDVLRGPPGLSGGPGPLGPHRNLATGHSLRSAPMCVVLQLQMSAVLWITW